MMQLMAQDRSSVRGRDTRQMMPTHEVAALLLASSRRKEQTAMPMQLPLVLALHLAGAAVERKDGRQHARFRLCRRATMPAAARARAIRSRNLASSSSSASSSGRCLRTA